MDKDRIAGAAKQAKGAVKEAAGKLVGDAKLQGFFVETHDRAVESAARDNLIAVLEGA